MTAPTAPTAPTELALVEGVNHVAVLTSDLDRFVAFYQRVFALEVVFTEAAPTFRHAILRTGPHSWLHPVQVEGSPHGEALPAMFQRGHLDHLSLGAASPAGFAEARRRLVEEGASDGDVEDLGAFHSLWFHDPDGMHGELTLILDDALRGIHAPRPLAEA